MSNKPFQPNLGDQFKNAVQEALKTGDFKELNLLVTDSVSDVISEAGKQVKQAASDIQNDVMWEPFRNAGSKTSVVPRPASPLAKTKNVGQISSILYMVFGGIGTALMAIILLIGLICMLIGFVWPTFLFIVLIVAFGGFILMIRKGITEKDRLKRMKRYISYFAGKMYINLSDLAAQAGKSTKYIVKDIKKMIELGFFPEGHLDQKETCLMLDDATYREYLKVEKERKAIEQEQAVKRREQADRQDAGQEEVNHELQTMIREGQEYIRRLHELNDLIQGEVISEKMYLMENLLKEIFKRLEEDPSQMSQLHKLMNYYLPTTIKLLQGYEEFDNISSPDENVIAAKLEIERTVDTINEAFASLLNKLFQATVFDVTTDAQVLQTMLAKEGLTKNIFSEDKK